MDIKLTKLYHFVSKREMYDKIEKISNHLKLNFSKTMGLIIEAMVPLLDYYIIFEQESDEFGYREFGAEVDVRFYINPNVYRKLKNAHGVMHTFSIASLLRKLIEIFFILIEIKSIDWLISSMKCGIKKILNVLYKRKYLYKNTENMVHMFEKEQMEEYISFIFSKNYTLLGAEIIKNRIMFQY